MRSFYLIKVWKESKPLFVGIIIFIFFQFFFIAKRIQNFPFFIFDMYSRPLEKPVSFTIYEIKESCQPINYTAYSNTKENVLLNSIQTYENAKKSYPNAINETVIEHRFKNKISSSNYQFIKNGLTNNKTSIDEFNNWLIRYKITTKDKFWILKSTYDYQNKIKKFSAVISSKDDI